MDIEDLEPGQRAPEENDRITVSLLPGGKFGFSGVALQGTVHAHFFEHGQYDTADEARAAGIAWAEERRVENLLVEHPNA
jgi:hypothetical protein